MHLSLGGYQSFLMIFSVAARARVGCGNRVRLARRVQEAVDCRLKGACCA